MTWVPRLSSEVILMRPECASMISLTRLRPRPGPSTAARTAFEAR